MRHFFILYVRDRTSFEYPPATYPISYYGNDHLKAIVLGIACDLTRTFGLNYSEIPNS